LTLSATATFAADLGSPCDKVVVNGNLNVDGTIQVANAALGSFELMSCTGTLTPGTLTVAGVPQNMTAHIDTTTLPKSLVLRLTSPTTVIMIQ
jgi:hypothetical protein